MVSSVSVRCPEAVTTHAASLAWAPGSITAVQLLTLCGPQQAASTAPAATWNTVTVLDTIPLKLLRLSDSNFPPKICIPSRAMMKMQSISRMSRAAMDAMEFTRDFTRFPMLPQYLFQINVYNR
jgi:hypothetical protein